MFRWIGGLFAALAFGLILSVVQAQDTTKNGKFDIAAIFKKLDTNSDGILSKDEFLKLADRYTEKEKARTKLTMAYDKIDPQNKGLSPDLLRKYLEGLRKKNGKS